jgi:hypothetical protein
VAHDIAAVADLAPDEDAMLDAFEGCRSLALI